MLDNFENLKAGWRLRDLQASLPSRESRSVRQSAGDHNRPAQSIRILAIPADLEIQRGVEVSGAFMNLPQSSGMDDEGQRWAATFSLNGFSNWRGNDKLWTAHKNSTGNIALQARVERRMQSPQTLNARAEYCGFVAILRQQGLRSASSGHQVTDEFSAFRGSSMACRLALFDFTSGPEAEDGAGRYFDPEGFGSDRYAHIAAS